MTDGLNNGKKPRPQNKNLKTTAGPGRPKGIPNKATKKAREAIATFIDGNAERLSDWLEEIYHQDGPKDAFKCFSDLLEYHVPKLARHEHTGGDGGPLVVEQKIYEFANKPPQ